MKTIEKLREQFSFFKGNYVILIISWILMDFAGELPGIRYSDYVVQLGGRFTVLGLIMLVSIVCLVWVQFLWGYLADKYGEDGWFRHLRLEFLSRTYSTLLFHLHVNGDQWIVV